MKASRSILSVCFGILLSTFAWSQDHHEFVAHVTYNPFSYSRFDSVPGVMYVGDNTAYDQNGKRIFFLGINSSMTPPWKLYTMNVLTGNIICQPTVPDRVTMLEYDNSSDTLYCIYINSSSQFYSAWIEPATGTIHLKSLLAQVNGYAPAIEAFDEIHHRIMFYGTTSTGGGLITVDALSGQILAMNSYNGSYLEYDNSTGHLYGIRVGQTELDSINELTGVSYHVGTLSSLGLYQNGVSAIDEANQHFISLR